MTVIYAILVMFGGFMVIGTICAIAENSKDRHEEKPEEPPRVIVTQQVPSVFDTFKGGKK